MMALGRLLSGAALPFSGLDETPTYAFIVLTTPHTSLILNLSYLTLCTFFYSLYSLPVLLRRVPVGTAQTYHGKGPQLYSIHLPCALGGYCLRI